MEYKNIPGRAAASVETVVGRKEAWHNRGTKESLVVTKS